MTTRKMHSASMSGDARVSDLAGRPAGLRKCVFAAVGCALALGASAAAGVETMRVKAGETVSLQPSKTAYAYYRLVIRRIADKVAWEADDSANLGSHKWLRLREIGLAAAVDGHGWTSVAKTRTCAVSVQRNPFAIPHI